MNSLDRAYQDPRWLVPSLKLNVEMFHGMPECKGPLCDTPLCTPDEMRYSLQTTG